MSQKYYIVDYGKDMVTIAEGIMEGLKDENHRTLIYLTDMPDFLMVQEVNELQFLVHGSDMSEN